MHRGISLKILLLLMMVSILAGCYDAREVNDVAYVLLVGVDRGVSDRFRVTFKFSSFESGGAQDAGDGQSQGGLTYRTLTIDAPSFFAASELANINIARTLNFMHTQFIVICEDIARTGLVGEFLGQIVRNSSIRYSTRLLISKESASEFIEKFVPIEGSDITKTCENLVRQSEETGMFADHSLYDLHDCITSTYHQPIAVLAAVNEGENFKEEGPVWGSRYKIPGDYYAGDQPRKEGGKVELMGLAIFNGDKMVGKLTGHESRLLAMVKGNFRKATFVIPDPKKPEDIIALEIRPARMPDVKVWFEEGKPFIDVKLHLEGDILGIQSGINYESPQMLSILENAFERFVKTELDKTIEKTQNLNCDIFYFGHKAVKSFATIQDWENYDWNSRYRDAEVTTEVNFCIRRTGTMIYISEIKFSREE